MLLGNGVLWVLDTDRSSQCKTPGCLSLLGIPWVNHTEPGLMQKARRIYCSSAQGLFQTHKRGSDHKHSFGKFLYGFQGQNRASATMHNMIVGTVNPLNWLVFREWGDKDFFCLKVDNSQSWGMCSHLQVGSCPVFWEMLISLSLPGGQVFHDLPQVPKLTFSPAFLSLWLVLCRMSVLVF
jgi:hypothetical protein